MVLIKQIHYMIMFEGTRRHFLNTCDVESMKLFMTHLGITRERPITNLHCSIDGKTPDDGVDVRSSDRIIVARASIADCFSIQRVGNQLQMGIRHRSLSLFRL